MDWNKILKTNDPNFRYLSSEETKNVELEQEYQDMVARNAFNWFGLNETDRNIHQKYLEYKYR